MNNFPWLSPLIRFLVLLPAGASCYLPAKNQMRFTRLQTAVLCSAVLLPYSFFCAWLSVTLDIETNSILLPSLVLLFFLYHRTVTLDLARELSIFIGVCAVQTFPAHIAYVLDSFLHPDSGASRMSAAAALLQLGLACLMPLLAYPVRNQCAWMIDHLNFPRIWYSTLAVSSVFLSFGILSVPYSYSTIHTGRIYYLYPLLEVFSLLLLVAIYMLFYLCASFLVKHADLKGHTRLLEMQSHQYRNLQEHMNQTKRLRHDFRHSVRLLSSLAEKGDLDSIRAHLAEYETRLSENPPVNYCVNDALNALFGYYHEMAAAAGIDTDWNIQLPEPLLASELDMAGLFGNLIENAIAGCQSVPRKTRYFSLTTEIRHRNCLYIVSTNNFNGQVRKNRDGYCSTKHTGKGTGLDSITAVAEKYHGSARFSNNEKEFLADVVLKI